MPTSPRNAPAKSDWTFPSWSGPLSVDTWSPTGDTISEILRLTATAAPMKATRNTLFHGRTGPLRLVTNASRIEIRGKRFWTCSVEGRLILSPARGSHLKSEQLDWPRLKVCAPADQLMWLRASVRGGSALLVVTTGFGMGPGEFSLDMPIVCRGRESRFLVGSESIANCQSNREIYFRY